MAGNTLIDGTAYKITGGKATITGAVHRIVSGKTRIDGTVYNINFKQPPKLSEVLEDMVVKTVSNRYSSSGSTTLPVLNYEDGDYILAFFKDKMTLMRDDQQYNIFDVNGGIELTFDYSVPSVKIDNNVEDKVYAATLMAVRFPSFEIDDVRAAFENVSVIASAGRNASSNAAIKILVSDVASGDYIFSVSGDYRKLNTWDGTNASVYNALGETSSYTHLIATSGELRFVSTSGTTGTARYGGTIIALREN